MVENDKIVLQDHAALIAEQVVIAAKKIADDLYSTKKEDTKRTNFLQYAITNNISIIAIFSVLTFGTVRNVQTTQTEQAKELVRLKTIQDANVTSVSILNNRVSAIEINQTDLIKSWVELNFIRKNK